MFLNTDMDRWDEWPQVNAELQRAYIPPSSEDRLIRAVLFSDLWSPLASSMTTLFTRLRPSSPIPLFLVDATKHFNVALELGVTTTPALVFFWQGRPVKVQRCGWEQDTKGNSYLVVGVCAEETLRKLLETAQSQVTAKGCLECS